MTISPKAIARRWIRARNLFSANRSEEGDILNAVKSAKPDAIMHFAANALVGESMTNPKKYFHNNLVNALKLADAAVECGVKKFVFSSTCATYGPPDRVPMTEDLPQRPINPYGESKLMFEKVLHLVSADLQAGVHRLPLFQRRRRERKIRRTSSHRDASDSERAASSRSARSRSARFTARIIRRPTAPASAITSTSRIWRRRTFSACSRARPDFTIWATATAIPCGRSSRCAKRSPAKKFPAVEKPRRPGDPPKLVASAEKAIRELGWKPKYPEAGRHRRHRLGVAPKASERLSGLNGHRFTAEKGCLLSIAEWSYSLAGWILK